MKFKNIITYIICLLFCFSFILTKEIGSSKLFPTEFINNFHFSFMFFLKSIILSLIVFVITKLLIYVIKKVKFKKNNTLNNKIFILIFLLIFSSGLLFLLTYYPVENMGDTLYILYSPISIATQHPLFYNLSIYIPYKIFLKLFSNVNLALFLTSTIQLIIMSSIITFILWWFNKTFKNKLLTIILSIYFVIVPIISNYNVALIKDSIFAGILLLYIPILYNVIITKGKWIDNKKNMILSSIVFILTSLIRNNGFYIIIFILFILIINYRKYYKSWILLLIISFISYKAPTLFVKDKPLFQEKVGVPIQQIAYTAFVDGDIKNNKEYLDKWFINGDIKSHYSPYATDTIKWSSDFDSEYFNSNEKELFSTYFDLLPNNFESYVKSYLLITYGYWNLDEINYNQSRFLGLDDTDENAIKLFPELHEKQLFPDIIQNFLTSFYETFTTYLSGGICLWILMFIIIYLINTNRYKYIIILLPLIGNFLTLMLSGPLSMAFRYTVGYAYLLPIIISIVLIKNNTKSNE